MSFLLIAGIERNPSLLSENFYSSTASSSFLDNLNMKSKLSIVHNNIQSITNKVDLIDSELGMFDIISLTETWPDHRTSNDDLNINGFNFYRLDRPGGNRGGICVYAKQDIYSRRRLDLELPNIECLRIEVYMQLKKALTRAFFYRPPNSAPAILASKEDSIGIAFDCGIENILITGGFNHDILKEASNKNIVDICQHHNLEQLINEPTHSTENTHSIIDIFLTTNLHSILLSRVGKPFLDQNIRYHCPIYCVFNFDKKIAHSYTRHI